MPRVKKFKLYAGRTLEVPKGVKYSFIPSHMQYLLLYTDTKPGEDFVKVPEDQLSREEHEWLLGCKYAVNSAAIQKNQQSYTNYLNNFLDNVEKELVAEQEKINNNSNNDNAKPKAKKKKQ